ncbi:MAG: hypothetical protein AAFU67_14250, partial [Bacteroidota bacterium]
MVFGLAVVVGYCNNGINTTLPLLIFLTKANIPCPVARISQKTSNCSFLISFKSNFTEYPAFFEK